MENIEADLIINQIAQGLKSAADGRAWFSSLTSEEKRQAIGELTFVLAQSHPLSYEVAIAIEKAQVGADCPACVILLKSQSNAKIMSIGRLPLSSLQEAFALIAELFKVSDQRRRDTTCKDGCNHWWHNEDLSSNESIGKLIEKYRRGMLT